MMPTKTTGRFRFRQAWEFPKEVMDWFVERLPDCERPVYHVPCGASQLGDVKMDLYFQAADVIKANMFALPVADATVPTIISDPPWELPYHLRGRLVKEFVRVLKPGGVLLFNSFWVPDHAELELEEIWIRWPKGGFPSNPSLLIKSRKRAVQQLPPSKGVVISSGKVGLSNTPDFGKGEVRE